MEKGGVLIIERLLQDAWLLRSSIIRKKCGGYELRRDKVALWRF